MEEGLRKLKALTFCIYTTMLLFGTHLFTKEVETIWINIFIEGLNQNSMALDTEKQKILDNTYHTIVNILLVFTGWIFKTVLCK